MWLQGHSPLLLPKTQGEFKQDVTLWKGRAFFLLMMVWELL